MRASRWNESNLQEFLDEHWQGIKLTSFYMNNDSKVILNVSCQNESHESNEFSLETLQQRIKNETEKAICHQCLIEDVEKEIVDNDLIPLNVQDYKNTKTTIECINDDGLRVRTNLDRIRSGKKPNPFKLNPYALDNIKILCERNGLELLKGQTYQGYDEPLYALKDGYKIKFRIENLFEGTTPSPFETGNKYVFSNIQTLCDKLGLNIALLPTSRYKETNGPIFGINNDGYTVKVRVFDILKGKTPKPFHPSNPFSIPNMRILCEKLGYELTIPSGQTYTDASTPILAIDEEGYKVMITVDGLQKKHKPLRFHQNNPHTIENIQLFCETYCPEYSIDLDQEYVGSKKNLKFILNGREEVQITWSNFKSKFVKKGA